MLGQVIISGLLAGALYSMVALGLGLIFGVMRVLNVSHGPLLMLGAYTTFWLFQWLGLNPYISLVVSMPLLFMVGMALQRLFVRRVVDAPELSTLLLTFGISNALVNLAQLAFTADLRSVEFLTGSFVVGPFAFSKSRVIACAFAIVITVGAFVFLKTTRLGKAIRAVSQSREVAQVCGVKVGRIHMLAFGIGSALAAAGGTLVAVMVAIQPEMGQIYTFKSFLVIVLGGAGNYPGALLGGLLLGLIEQISSLFLPTQVNEAVAYVLLVVLALYPIAGTGYGVRFMLQLFMWIALAQSWNLISGLTGYVSFGHIAFFGMGAYTAGILIAKLGWPWLLASLAGGLGAVVLALVIGFPCLRLKGPYFAIAMLGLNEVLRVAVSYFERLTGGGSGLSLPALYASVPIYYAMGLTAAAVTALAYVIVTSRFGLRLMTIREDEVAAEAMGIDTFRYKLYAFLLSAVAPGIVGGLAARDQSYIEPISVFPLIMAITMIVMVLFGGKGTIWGPVLGAVLLFTLQEMIWARFIYLHQLLFGAIIITVVLLMPRGILGVLQQKYNLPRTI